VVKFYLDRYLLYALSAKGALVIAAEGIDLAINCSDNSMEGSTGNLIDGDMEQWIGNNHFLPLLSFLLTLHGELFNVRKTNWPF
jgi:hypothetical protein